MDYSNIYNLTNLVKNTTEFVIQLRSIIIMLVFIIQNIKNDYLLHYILKTKIIIEPILVDMLIKYEQPIQTCYFKLLLLNVKYIKWQKHYKYIYYITYK